jgi:hypothetical protein
MFLPHGFPSRLATTPTAAKVPALVQDRIPHACTHGRLDPPQDKAVSLVPGDQVDLVVLDGGNNDASAFKRTSGRAGANRCPLHTRRRPT